LVELDVSTAGTSTEHRSSHFPFLHRQNYPKDTFRWS
jgi:hypothetical protein